MKVTLDNNCIIALKGIEQNTPSMQRLLVLHNMGTIAFKVVGIGASELQPGRIYAANFSEFKEKLAAVGLEHAEILVPIGYWDVTFWDNCIYPGQEASRLEQNIHDVLFPDIEFDYQAFCRVRGLDPLHSGKAGELWRNRKCDVLTMWCHITYGCDIFVTDDHAFLKTKKQQLIDLGARDIVTPKEAVTKLEAIKP